LDFESLDGQPTYLFCLIIGPKKKYGPHIQLLSSLAGILKKEEVRNKLFSGPSRSDVYSLFIMGKKKAGH